MRIVVNKARKPMVFAMQSKLGAELPSKGVKRGSTPALAFLAVYRVPLETNNTIQKKHDYIVHEFHEFHEEMSVYQLEKLVRYYEKVYYSQNREIENVEEALLRLRLWSDEDRHKETPKGIGAVKITKRVGHGKRL